MITSNNHTQMPNEIIDVYMKQLSDKAFKVLSVICRKTIGWHKETDSISASQIVNISGLSRSSVLRSIKELEDLKLIIVDRDAVNYSTNKYTINYTLSDDTCVTKRQGGCQADTGGGVTETHTKESILNKDIKKEFIKPSLEEVKAYVKQMNYSFNPVKFYEYYTVLNWNDSNGKPIKNWKLKALTWNNRNTTDKPTNNSFVEMGTKINKTKFIDIGDKK